METILTLRQSMLLNPMLAGLALLAGLASMSSCGEVQEGIHIISNNEDIVEEYYAASSDLDEAPLLGDSIAQEANLEAFATVDSGPH